MKKVLIEGGNKLKGEIEISGAKNASLPILMSTILVEEGESIILNVPAVADVVTTLELLGHLGAKVQMTNDNFSRSKVFTVKAQNINTVEAPYSIVSKMRASFWVLGSLVGRFGEAKVSLPGGCSIGLRPCDIYIDALNKMQVDTKIVNGYVVAKAKKHGKPQGADIMLRFPSVGATHNTIMAAVLAEGDTIIRNAAKEPEIVDLANFLNSCGAKIEGAGTDTVYIGGVKSLKAVQYKVMGDRIETFGYIVASAITNSNLILSGLDFFNILKYPLEILEKIGITLKQLDNRKVEVISEKKLKPTNIVTQVYPGFPTDCQALIMALLGVVKGESSIDETIFENRFMHVPELARMGANIITEGNKAIIIGVDRYYGAEVRASDIRGGMSLVLAGLAAKGQTKINHIHHLERGYENLIEKLTNCGANIKIIDEE